MFYLKNYGEYYHLVVDKEMDICVTDITKENWNDHFKSVLNIMRDGIDTEVCSDYFIHVKFPKCTIKGLEHEEIIVDLTLVDYYNNLLLWYLLVSTDQLIQPWHIIFERGTTADDIKKFIDEYLISSNRTKYDNMYMNNIIDDCMYNYMSIDEFSFFLSNTINLEDFRDLMNQYPEFYDLIHTKLSNVPLDDVKAEGMKAANKSIQYIENSDHCLAPFFLAREGVNIKQYKEYSINIGTKPDGKGGVYPVSLDSNYLTGGVNDPVSYYIESSNGRIAQIIVEGNVGISGNFARLLGLNNLDTILNTDPHYDCATKNFQKFFIKDEYALDRLKNRYYRLNPKGIEYRISGSESDKQLIGQTIYLRSPMTCASAAHGHGICYKCYGDLAYTNKDINPGKLAAEELSSKLTQRMLSAKHLLESATQKMTWNKEIADFITVDSNMLKFNENMDLTGYKLIIDPEAIILENEDSEEKTAIDFNEYVNEFILISPVGDTISFHTSNSDNLYITEELNECIRSKSKVHDQMITLDAQYLKDEEIPIFAIQIYNNDLSVALKKVQDVLDKSKVTTSYNKDDLLQVFTDVLREGSLNIDYIHAEVILSNQLRSTRDILKKPDWSYPNEEYQVLTLKQALSKNPSTIVSFNYANISKLLYSPLTYKKTSPSFLDLFYMEQPQMFMNDTENIVKADEEAINKDKGMIQIMHRIEDIDSSTGCIEEE